MSTARSISSQAQTGAIATSANPLQIGGDSIYGQFFQGAIDEVRIYNRALAQAEIQTDMNAPLGNSIIPPTNLTATAVSGNQVDLTWSAAQSNLGISSYRIERCQAVGCTNFGLIATTPTTVFSDTTVVANATFRYRVQAVDSGGNISAYSNVADAFTGLTIHPQIAALTPIETRQFVGHRRQPGWRYLVCRWHRWRKRLVRDDHDRRAIHTAELSPACTR